MVTTKSKKKKKITKRTSFVRQGFIYSMDNVRVGKSWLEMSVKDLDKQHELSLSQLD